MGHIPSVKIDAAPGELIDKITILEIKAERIDDAMKRANVTYELATLTNAMNLAIETSEQISDLSGRLKEVNERLWETEDAIRECESRQDFGQVFIDLARSVYRLNDVRADLKRSINMLLGARIVEEKSYSDY
jgi:ABC-type Fe3+-citrate transport system substrate-binding protein